VSAEVLRKYNRGIKEFPRIRAGIPNPESAGRSQFYGNFGAERYEGKALPSDTVRSICCF